MTRLVSVEAASRSSRAFTSPFTFTTAAASVVETMTWPFNTGTRKAMAKLGFDEVQIVYRQSLSEDL